MRNVESRRSAQYRWVSLVLVGALSFVGLAVSVLPTAAEPSYSGAGLFSTTTTPSGYTIYSDNTPVELGVRFSPKVSGSATGVRVFKAVRASYATPLSGTLWSPSGQRLATAAFDRTRATGWQYVTFSRPVPLTVGQTYTVSVFASSGKYAATDYGFSRPTSTDSLTAPATGNGVYTYSASSSFPRNTWKSSNYWVDVQFLPTMSPATTAPATTAPATTAPATTAPATTAPATTAPATTSSDLKGWQLNSANVGLAPYGVSCATLPVYTGSSKPAAGARISKVRITSNLDLSNGDIEIDKSCIKPNVGNKRALVSNDICGSNECIVTSPKTVIIRDSEFDASDLPVDQIDTACAFRGVGTLQRNYMHDMDSGICFFGTGYLHDAIAEQNYVTLKRNTLTGHRESATIRDFRLNQRPDRQARFLNNRLDTEGDRVTASLFIQSTWVDIYNVTAEGNYLEGAGYNFYMDKGAYSGTYGNIDLINNRFRPTGWGARAVGSGPGVTEWSENYRYAATGTDCKGVVVPEP
jgi:Domain of unknown function (DUF4082)